jgi:hypothetical protein
MTLHPVICPSCGHPSGVVVDSETLESMTFNEQLCTGCSGVVADGEDNETTVTVFQCPGCGNSTDFYLRRTNYDYIHSDVTLVQGTDRIYAETPDDEVESSQGPWHVICGPCERDVTTDTARPMRIHIG